MKKSNSQLIQEALQAVHAATGISYSDFTSSELRRILVELAEDGAWTQYEGDGYFDNIHVSEMSDREIARILIRDYQFA